MNKYFRSWNECKDCMYADAFRYVGHYGEVKLVEWLKFYLRHPNYRYVFWMRLAQFLYGRSWLKLANIYIYKITDASQ